LRKPKYLGEAFNTREAIRIDSMFTGFPKTIRGIPGNRLYPLGQDFLKWASRDIDFKGARWVPNREFFLLRKSRELGAAAASAFGKPWPKSQDGNLPKKGIGNFFKTNVLKRLRAYQ